MSVKIKICGMTNIDNISKILFLEPDYLGFILWTKSPRCAIGKLNPDMLSIIPEDENSLRRYKGGTLEGGRYLSRHY